MLENNLHFEYLNLENSDKIFKAVLCFYLFSIPEDYKTLPLFLHPQEGKYYESLQFERRIKNFLLGRYVAKNAVGAFTGEKSLKNILIEAGIFAQPVVISAKPNVQVSITHCGDLGAAVAFPEAHPMGIDLEVIDYKNRRVLEGQMTEAEKKKISRCFSHYDSGLTLLWTAKEALSKVFKTGMLSPLKLFEATNIECFGEHVITRFANFKQYKAMSMQIGDYFCTIVYPVKSELRFTMPNT